MGGTAGGDPVKARIEHHRRPTGSFGIAILGQTSKSRALSLLIGLLILIVLTSYALQTVGRRPWEVGDMVDRPSVYEGMEVVLTLSVRDYELSDSTVVEVERDGRVVRLPLRFPVQPDLFWGATLSLKGESRLESLGVILVNDYHVANPRPKAILSALGAAICGLYLVCNYAFAWRHLAMEPR